jgi:palmitoyl-protein thioesterase
VNNRRGLIQRCEGAKVINFISLGGQHQGIFGVPECSAESHLICGFYRLVLNYFAYTNWAQNHVAQATYWHDPIHEEKYRKRSTFLADINNERGINKDYIRRLQSLNKFVMVKFLRDKIVQPIETSWFGFYKPGSDKTVLSLTESELFLRDKLGLKRMLDHGKIVFIEVYSFRII